MAYLNTTLHLFRKLFSAHFTHILTQGTNSFDVSLAKVLPLYLYMAVDFRPEYITVSSSAAGKIGQYMKHEDICLVLKRESEGVTGVVAEVVIRNEKAKK